MLASIALLSRICTRPQPAVEDILRACEVARDALGAADVYIVRAGDPHFVRVGSESEPESYEIKQRGYWLVWRELAANQDMVAAWFRTADRLVMEGAALTPDSACTHVAMLLPGDESNSEMLVARGPWPEGPGQERCEFLEAVRPILACLVVAVLDADKQARHREQLEALSDVARAFTDASTAENALQAVATALAKASGFDWVTINLFDPEITRVVRRVTNNARHSNTETAQIATQATWDILVTRAREVRETRRPYVIPDVFDPGQGTSPELAAYYQRAHLLSVSTFPMFFQDQLLGTVNYSSSTRRQFSQSEVAFLSGLTSQAATSIKGIQLYQELEEASRIEHHLARTDALTGIPNRRYIEEVLRAECARAERLEEPMSVVMADMDRFKVINDSFGHQAGDEALRHVASVARQTCREADFVGRWGGDEFFFILPETRAEDGAAFAEQFRANLAETRFRIPDCDEAWAMTVSAGVAQRARGDRTAPDALFRLADRALYSAKEMGRDRVVILRERAAAA